MKKKSTKKMASTKHDNLPNKVRSENMNEDGHTDVASAERKLKLIMKDAMDTLNALRNLSNEDSLPSWWTDKITLAKDYVGKSRDFIMNPTESVNEESKTIKSIQNLADKNKYGTVSGTRMNGKTAKEIIAIYNHPKMKSFRGKMDKMKSHELMDLTIRLPKMLGIKVESINKSIPIKESIMNEKIEPKVKSQIDVLDKRLRDLKVADARLDQATWEAIGAYAKIYSMVEKGKYLEIGGFKQIPDALELLNKRFSQKFSKSLDSIIKSTRDSVKRLKLK